MNRITESALLTCAAALILLNGCATPNPRVATKLNQPASLPSSLPFDPLHHGQIITSWVDQNTSSMSTLYGNETAVRHARTSPESAYPDGSILAVVTWKQREDDRWFGGKIPSQLHTVELLRVSENAKHEPTFALTQYSGSPLRAGEEKQETQPSERTAWILSQHAAILP